jgi:hypothetical protein
MVPRDTAGSGTTGPHATSFRQSILLSRRKPVSEDARNMPAGNNRRSLHRLGRHAGKKRNLLFLLTS